MSMRIETADDESCGVLLSKSTDAAGDVLYSLACIEDRRAVGQYPGLVEAIVAAGEFLTSYATDAISEFPNPDGPGTIAVDWSATVRQGERLIDLAEAFAAGYQVDFDNEADA